MNKQETPGKAATKWVFETNSHKWSNNDDTAGDNYGSFLAGYKLAQERSYSEEEVIAFGEFIFKHSLLTHTKGVKNLFEQFKKK